MSRHPTKHRSRSSFALPLLPYAQRSRSPHATLSCVHFLLFFYYAASPHSSSWSTHRVVTALQKAFGCFFSAFGGCFFCGYGEERR
ncbi:hypothetical protein HN51_000271 [Arachis hypogaea]